MAEPKVVPVEWPPSVGDVPTYYANMLMVSHAGPEFFLVFGEASPPPPGIVPDTVSVHPIVKIAVTPDVMVSMARAIQNNVEKYLAEIEQQEEET
jgi:hypothetical protein